MRLKLEGLSGVLKASTAKPQVPTLPPARTPRSKNGKQVAELNSKAVLRFIGHFGHLRVAEIARAVWPHRAYGEQMALRTLRRLEKESLVVPRRNAVGGMSYVLTRRGAAWLDLRGIEARHGLDLSSVAGGTFMHRTISTRFLIERQIIGHQVAGEYAVQQGRLPFSLDALTRRTQKLPDGLTWTKSMAGESKVWLVETEHAPKPMEEIIRILKPAEFVGTWIDPSRKAKLVGLVVLFDSALNHCHRILRAADRLWGHQPSSSREVLESSVRLVFVELGAPLVWRRYSELNLAEFRRQKQR